MMNSTSLFSSNVEIGHAIRIPKFHFLASFGVIVPVIPYRW